MTGEEPAKKGESEPTEGTRPADDSGPFAALAFKIMSDPYVGKLTYFRVYSGKLRVRRSRAERQNRAHRAHRPPADDAREPPGRIEEPYSGVSAPASV